jgi:hypothetical protein
MADEGRGAKQRVLFAGETGHSIGPLPASGRLTCIGIYFRAFLVLAFSVIL